MLKSLVLSMLFGFGVLLVQVVGASSPEIVLSGELMDRQIWVLEFFCSNAIEEMEEDIVEQEKFCSEDANYIKLLNHITKDKSDLYSRFDGARILLDPMPDDAELARESSVAKLFFLKMRLAVCQVVQDNALWRALYDEFSSEVAICPEVDVSKYQEALASKVISVRDMKKLWDDGDQDGTWPSFGWGNEALVAWRLSTWETVLSSNDLLSSSARWIITQWIAECDRILTDLRIGDRNMSTPDLKTRGLLRNK